MSKTRNRAKPGLRLQGDLTIYRVLEHFEAMRGALESNASVLRIDLSAVGEIDSAGLQLLMLLRRRAEARGAQLAVVQASPVVRELLGFCNLGALLAGPATAAGKAA